MEQLFETFGIDWKLLLAQIVNFGVLAAGLTYFLYRPVMKTLDDRRAKVAQGIEDAEEASEKLANADALAAEAVKGAETEAEGIVASAREFAGGEKERIVGEAQARAAQVAQDAEARAETLRAAALRDSEREIARLAVLAAEKVLRESK
jgi:F-type H+-transporting ATPase subunit b